MIAKWLLPLLVLASGAAHANYEISCRASQVVDSTYFDHSLSVHEHANVVFKMSAMGDATLDVGTYSYSTQHGDRLHFVPSIATDQILEMIDATSGDIISLKRGTDKTGQLRVKEKGSTKFVLIARLLCK